MFGTNHRKSLRSFSAVCLMLVQAILPCVVTAQVGQGRQGVGEKLLSAAPSGFLNSISGTVFMRKGNGPEVLAKLGDLIDSGTVLRTGLNAQVNLLFADGQNVNLSADSTLRIDDYRFDQNNIKAGRATLGLMAGMMRVVTGAIHTGNPEALRITAGDAVISILSKDVTAFIVEVHAKSQEYNSIAVIVGEVSIQTPVGAIIRVATDQFTRWHAGVAPVPPQPLVAAPAVFQAMITAARATVLPTNVQEDIQAAAFSLALSALPATAAGAPQAQVQAEPVAPVAAAAAIVPAVTPGGGRGCVGSPC